MFKHLLFKYYPKFSKISRVGEHLNQFLMLLYDCMPRLSQFLRIDKLLKNANVLQLRMGKNPTTPLHKKNKKHEINFDEKKFIKIVKITKQSYAYKDYASTYNADILNFFNHEIKLKNTESAIENKLKGLFLM